MATIAMEINFTELQSGDIVLTKGKALASKVIMLASQYSHVGVLWRDPDTRVLYIIESTSLNKFSNKKGVQMSEFERWLKHYDGQVDIRVSCFDMNYCECKEMKRKYDEVSHKEYEPDKWELIKSALDFGVCLFKNKENLKYLFCSELVAYLLKCLGYILTDLPCNEFAPDDFAPGGLIDKCLVKDGLLSSTIITVKG